VVVVVLACCDASYVMLLFIIASFISADFENFQSLHGGISLTVTSRCCDLFVCNLKIHQSMHDF